MNQHSKHTVSGIALFFLTLSSPAAHAATITGLAPAAGGGSSPVPTAITYDQGMVTNTSNFLPMWNKGTVYSNPYDSKWYPDRLTFYYSTNSSGGYYNSSIDWLKTTYNHFSSSGNRTATFGLLSQYTTGQEGLLLNYTPYYPSFASPTQEVRLLSGSEIMERRYNQTTYPPLTQISYVKAETDVTYTATTATVEVNGQAGPANSGAVYLNQSPAFLWSASLNNNGTGTLRDYPIVNFGGASHTLNLYKRPQSYAAAAGPFTPSVVIDPEAETMTLGTKFVLTGTATPGVIALGQGTTASGGSKTVLGRYNTAATGSDPDVVFAVGSGTSAVPSDALIVRADGSTDVNTLLADTAGITGAATFNAARSAAGDPVTVKTNADYIVNGINSSNALRITPDGAILIKPQGNIPMGNFTGGPTP